MLCRRGVDMLAGRAHRAQRSVDSHVTDFAAPGIDVRRVRDASLAFTAQNHRISSIPCRSSARSLPSLTRTARERRTSDSKEIFIWWQSVLALPVPRWHSQSQREVQFLSPRARRATSETQATEQQVLRAPAIMIFTPSAQHGKFIERVSYRSI